MRHEWILALGLAVVLMGATHAVAHRGIFIGRGFGAPMQPFVVVPRGHAFFGFGAPVRPFIVRPPSHLFLSFGFGALGPPVFVVPRVLVAPPVLVAPAPLVSPPFIFTVPPAPVIPHGVIVITPRRW